MTKPSDSSLAEINRTTSNLLPIASCTVAGRTVRPMALDGRVKGWQEKQVDVVGFNLCLDQLGSLEERLKLVAWSADLSKWDFVKQG